MTNKKFKNIMGLIVSFLFISAYAHADVQVSSEGTYSGSELTLNIYADTTISTENSSTAVGDAEPILSYGIKVTYDTDDIISPVVTKNNTDWFFGTEGGTTYATPNADPFVTEAGGVGEIVFVGGKLDQAAPTAGVDTTTMPEGRVLLATIVFQRESENVPAITVDIGKGGTYANFVTTDGDVLDGTARLEFLAASITPECNLVGDLNGDGRVNLIDFGLFRENYGAVGSNIADLNSDGRVNLIDFGLFRSNYGTSCQ